MDTAELTELVALMRASATDLVDIEVKASAGGLPRSVRDTISAFSNGHGGTIILGLDEQQSFAPVPGFEPQRIQASLGAACSEDLEPPVRAQIDVVPFEGHPLVIGEIAELDPRFKPCFVKARGEHGGSFVRTGDGDRRLTDFEIHLLHSSRGQPRDDLVPVDGAGVDDLNSEATEAFLRRVRYRQPRAFTGLDDQTALQRLNVVTSDDRPAPTLAGLLTFGTYPQHFFPQLNVTLVVYPGRQPGDTPEGGPRFIDNRAFDGSIPEIVVDAIGGMVRNMALRSYVEGVGRSDVYDYPVGALREALVNALVHRDYSQYSQGSPVQIAMYTDRLVIANPGGLYGSVTPDDLGREGVTSSRNPALIKILQDARLPDSEQTVCENRGSGIPAMLQELRQVHARPPEFRHRISRFSVTFSKPPSSPVPRRGGGGKVPDEVVDHDDMARSVLDAVPADRSVTRQEVQDATGLAQATVIRQLNLLVQAGLIEATAPARSPHRRYVRVVPRTS